MIAVVSDRGKAASREEAPSGIREFSATLNIYRHVLPAVQNAAADEMNALLSAV